MAVYTTSLYPHYGASNLRQVSGHTWAQLIDHINQLPRTDDQVIALAQMVRRIRRDLGLDPQLAHDPFLALDAATVLAFYEGSEYDLLSTYYSTLKEVRAARERLKARSRAAEHIA